MKGQGKVAICGLGVAALIPEIVGNLAISSVGKYCPSASQWILLMIA
jgi:hypothetical protein